MIRVSYGCVTCACQKRTDKFKYINDMDSYHLVQLIMPSHSKGSGLALDILCDENPVIPVDVG